MENVIEIPGLLERMVEAKILPPATPLSIPDVVPVATVLPNTIPQTQVLASPNTTVAAVSKKGGTWGYWLGGALVLGYLFRYEIGYYILGKPNKKYPKY